MPRTPDRTQPGSLLVKGVPPSDGPIRPSRPAPTAGSNGAAIALPKLDSARTVEP